MEENQTWSWDFENSPSRPNSRASTASRDSLKAGLPSSERSAPSSPSKHGRVFDLQWNAPEQEELKELDIARPLTPLANQILALESHPLRTEKNIAAQYARMLLDDRARKDKQSEAEEAPKYKQSLEHIAEALQGFSQQTLEKLLEANVRFMPCLRTDKLLDCVPPETKNAWEENPEKAEEQKKTLKEINTFGAYFNQGKTIIFKDISYPSKLEAADLYAGIAHEVGHALHDAIYGRDDEDPDKLKELPNYNEEISEYGATSTTEHFAEAVRIKHGFIHSEDSVYTQEILQRRFQNVAPTTHQFIHDVFQELDAKYASKIQNFSLQETPSKQQNTSPKNIIRS